MGLRNIFIENLKNKLPISITSGQEVSNSKQENQIIKPEDFLTSLTASTTFLRREITRISIAPGSSSKNSKASSWRKFNQRNKTTSSISFQSAVNWSHRRIRAGTVSLDYKHMKKKEKTYPLTLTLTLTRTRICNYGKLETFQGFAITWCFCQGVLWWTMERSYLIHSGIRANICNIIHWIIDLKMIIMKLETSLKKKQSILLSLM